MPTVVDSLIITLGLDPKNFNQGQKDVVQSLIKTKSQANQTAKDMENDGKRAGEYFSHIKTQALSLFGVLLGGRSLERFAKEATTDMAALGREARNIGVAVPQLTAFTQMIERNGGSAQAATASFKGYADAIERFKVFGDASILQFLNPIHADVNDDPMTVFNKFMKFVEENKDKKGGIQLINLEGRGLGFDQGLINAAIQIGTVKKAVDGMNESIKNGAPGQDAVDRLTKLQTAVIGLGQAAENTSIQLLSDFAPSLEQIAKKGTALINEHPQIVQAIEAIGTALAVLGAVRISAKIMGLGGIVTFLETIISRLTLIGAAVGITFEALHIDSLNKGEDAEIKREDEAHGEHHDHPDDQPKQPTRDPFKTWMRNHVKGMAEGPIKEWMKKKFGTDEVANKTLEPEQTAFLQTISEPESGGDYYVRNGGEDVKDLEQFPEGVGKNGTSSATGRYQITRDTWNEFAPKVGATNLHPENQDRVAWQIASDTYQAKTGRSLLDDLRSGGHEAQIIQALKSRWSSLPGGVEQGLSQAQFTASLKQNTEAARHPQSTASAASQPAGATTDVPTVSLPNGVPSNLGRALPPPGNQAAPVQNTMVSVGQVTVNTQATDAKGIAKDLHKEITTQANRGLG